MALIDGETAMTNVYHTESRILDLLKNKGLVDGFISIFDNIPFDYNYSAFEAMLYEQGRQIALQLRMLGYTRSKFLRKAPKQDFYLITRPAAMLIEELRASGKIILI
jgi:hypothetical protein